MTATLEAPVQLIAPIGLAELIAAAALQTRIDRKYLVPTEMVDQLLHRIAADALVLEIDQARTFAYESVYFDTSDLAAFHLAAHRRRRRFKVRTRTYLNSGECWLEVKTRGARGTTVKNRTPHDARHAAVLRDGRDYVHEVLTDQSVHGATGKELHPTLMTRYLRTTLLLPSTTSRVTIDTALAWHDGDGHSLDLPHLAVIETKTGSTASAMDRLLWSDGHRPVGISKYATGLAALRPELPSTRWRHTLRTRLLAPPPDSPTPRSPLHLDRPAHVRHDRRSPR